MNREIKFRAWDKKGRFEMAKVMVMDFSEKYVCVDEGWNKDYETGIEDCVANFDEIELMQYTGLKDKNGKEIYEGDIMTIKNTVGDLYAVVEWSENSAKFKWGSQFHVFNREHASWFRIVGNIYENPDLISAIKGEV